MEKLLNAKNFILQIISDNFSLCLEFTGDEMFSTEDKISFMNDNDGWFTFNKADIVYSPEEEAYVLFSGNSKVLIEPLD